MSANGLRPYPSYRDSGLDWLGEVPEHWEVRRLKFLLRARHARSVLGKEQLLRVSQYTGITKRRGKDTRAESLIGYRRVAPSDLVVNIMLAWNGSLGVSPFGGIVSPAYCVYRFGANTHPRYAHYLLRSPLYRTRIKTVSTGVVESRLRLYTDDLYRLEALLPPLPEQRAIVRFLDATDRRIRRYIRAKERLIELLEERKRALIREAVTGRIDVRTGQPYLAYKDSGVEWLGKVPEPWEVRRLKTISHMQSGEAITAMSINPNGDYRVFGGNGLRGYTSDYTHDGEFVLIGRQGALCGNIHLTRGRFWASEHAVVATLSPAHVLEWFGALLEVMDLNQYSIAAAQPGLSVDRVLNLWAPVPPADEQVLMSKGLIERGRKMGDALVTAKRQIALLREYRTRLIADVVTGKLDVCEAAARLPETDPLAGDRDPAESIPTESNLRATAQDMMKEASE